MVDGGTGLIKHGRYFSNLENLQFIVLRNTELSPIKLNLEGYQKKNTVSRAM